MACSHVRMFLKGTSPACPNPASPDMLQEERGKLLYKTKASAQSKHSAEYACKTDILRPTDTRGVSWGVGCGVWGDQPTHAACRYPLLALQAYRHIRKVVQPGVAMLSRLGALWICATQVAIEQLQQELTASRREEAAIRDEANRVG